MLPAPKACLHVQIQQGQRSSRGCDAVQVDCAYYSDGLQEVDLDPGRELKQLLQARGLESLESACPECFENQQKLVSFVIQCLQWLMFPACLLSSNESTNLSLRCLICFARQHIFLYAALQHMASCTGAAGVLLRRQSSAV